MSNGVIFQAFQWYLPSGALWSDLAGSAQALADAGFTAVWIPPCSKGAGGGYDVGYGAYDLFDLGEFDQKNSVPTKYGTREELLDAVAALQQRGLQVYCDVVFNHKDGGDYVEWVRVQHVDWHDRNRTYGDPYHIHAWTHFTFPNRNGKYSSMKWNWWHFDALSHNATTGDNSRLFRLKDKRFETGVSHEHGNYDYLMATDLDTRDPFVDGELRWWGRWIIDTAGFDGFRIDAVKHIRSTYFTDWLNHLRVHFARELFAVGEYWSGDVRQLHGYLAASQDIMSLFDVPLHYRFHHASRSGNAYDMRTIFDDTLVKHRPAKAVTFVENHDSQPCQSLESPVEPWFKPHAYAMILLRRDGYPCVFHGDYHGAFYHDKGRDATLYSHRFLIDRFLDARRRYNYGEQHDYFDHPNTIAWFRTGDAQHPGCMAVVLTNGGAGHKSMNTFRANADFRDVTGHFAHKITTDATGRADFPCRAGSVSVWVH